MFSPHLQEPVEVKTSTVQARLRKKYTMTDVAAAQAADSNTRQDHFSKMKHCGAEQCQCQEQCTEVAVKRQWRCRADILEFRGVGRHEGPKALISERTPRQTEREKKEWSKGRRREEGNRGRVKASVRGIERREEKDVSEGKSRMQGIPRSFKKKRTDGKR